MARIRSIRPEYFTDADLCELPPLTRVAFQGLWCHADREGKLPDKPRELKVKILPYDDWDMDKALTQLAPRFITRYQVGEQKLIKIRNFLKHQHPHKDEADSQLPDPPEEKPKARAPRKHGARTMPAPCSTGGEPAEAPPLSVSKTPGHCLLSLGACSPSASPATTPENPEALTVVPVTDDAFRLEPVKAQRERRPSPQEKIRKWFEGERAAALGQGCVPDQIWGVARTNAALKPLVQVNPAVLGEAVRLFFRDPQKQGLDPPCPLWAFAQDWPKYVSAAQRSETHEMVDA